MAAENVETEIKLLVSNLDDVAARLIVLGAALHAPRVFERNARYDLPDGSLTAKGVVLRLRQDSRARLTYKEAGTLSDGVMSRFEAEVEVSDFGAMETILLRLGYVFSFAYEKYRTTYVLNRCEVTLDEMPFGSFVEIEGEAGAILEVVRQLDLDSAPRIELSYAGAFNALRAHLGLSFKDATFENFSGVVLGPYGNLETILKTRSKRD
jgi:adenylate cyclase, class 2